MREKAVAARRGLPPTAAALSLAVLAGNAHAQQPQPRLPQPGAAISAPTPSPPSQRLLYRSTALARINPEGLFEELRLGYRLRLFESESPLLRDNFVGAGLAVIGSPGLAAVAPSFELQPLSVLQFTASYTGYYYFGNFGHLQSFPSAAALHSDTERERREDAGLNYDTTLGQITLQPLVQMKFGPIAMRSATRFVYNLSHLRAGDRAAYDPVFDLLVPRRGWVIANDTDLVALTPSGFGLGVRYSMAHAIYSADDFAPGEPQKGSNQTIQRVGPLVTYTFFDRPGARYNTPTILLLSQWWVDQAYRTGRDVSQALPYLVLGFSFSGDLLLSAYRRRRRRKARPPAYRLRRGRR